MKMIKTIMTLTLSGFGVLVGLFIYNRHLMILTDRVDIYYNVFGIDSPYGCLFFDRFADYFGEYVSSFLITTICLSVFVATIIKSFTGKRPKFNNYQPDRHIRGSFF